MTVLLFCLLWAGDGIVVDAPTRTVSFTATLQPNHFNALTSWPKNHHFIVWRGGRAARNALILADPPDIDVQRALETLGAVPANNVPQEAWDKRADSQHPAPDTRVAGPKVGVTVVLPDGRRLKPEDLFEDHGGEGFVFRFGGHEALIPAWRSGCVVCLESCPGGRVSNAAYTLRDYHTHKARFSLKSGLPHEDTPVTVILHLVDEAH